MSDRIRSYLAKRADLNRHEVQGLASTTDVDTVIVIPALAEENSLPATLESLSRCNADRLAHTAVLVVVNNRPADLVEPAILAENQRTFTWLLSNPCPALRLACIDASSPDRELARKEGVGGARKIGLDHAVHLLLESQSPSPLLVCLDADTLVESSYLDALDHFAKSEKPWAGVLDYAHSIPVDASGRAAIIAYELFLRYQALGLRHANSPYAYHTIGSTMVCSPEAYAAVSGMNRRSAGEDFYFLQQLAKTGSVASIAGTVVHPSHRSSWRVPFGTGKRVGRFLADTHAEYRVYHPDSYVVLKDWFETVSAHRSASGDSLIDKAHRIHPELAIFLENLDFASRWAKLQSNAQNPDQLYKQFHCFFDSFQSLKLIHHLRDTALHEQNTFEALNTVFRLLDIAIPIAPDIQQNLDAQHDLLQKLRAEMTAST